MINEFMEQLVKDLELPESIAVERAGVYSLPMDEETSIEVKDNPPGYTLFSSVAPIPPQEKEGLFCHALFGNLLGQGTEGAVLGLTEDGKQLTLTLNFEYPTTYKDFKENLEEFINVVDFWREEVRLHKAGKLL